MNPAVSLIKDAKVQNIISDRTTMEFILEKLSKGYPLIQKAPGGIGVKISNESTALVVSSELSVLITASQFAIKIMTDLWDSKEDYGYATRGKGEYNINKPCVSLLGASSPDWLVKSVTADAIGGGFTRRVNFVYATKKDKSVAWPSKNGNLTYSKLVDDLKEIGQLQGEFKFSATARILFEAYYHSCEPDEFDDEATAVYKTSKWANASKVAMCLAASRSDNLVIEATDFQRACDMTEEIAEDLKIVFRAVGESPLISAQDKVMRFLEIKGYATRAEILAINYRHVTADDLDRVVATLREAGIISEKQVGKKTMYYITKGVVQVNP